MLSCLFISRNGLIKVLKYNFFVFVDFQH